MSASKFKDSNVDWIGKIPSHWELTAFKRMCRTTRGQSPRPIDDPKYWDDEGEYGWVRISDVTRSGKYLKKTRDHLTPLGTSKSLALEPGELIISIAATVGVPSITGIKCCIHDGFVHFTGLDLDLDYVYNLLTIPQIFSKFGKKGTQTNINSEIIGVVKIPVPPINEQKEISVFIGGKTNIIDKKIRYLERKKLLIEEKQSALITQAVTKGLNPDVPMKGIDSLWIDHIPEDWTNARIKQIVSTKVTDGPHITPVQVDEGVPFLSATAVENGRLNMNKMWGYISREDHELYCRKCLPQLEDIFMVKSGATTGSIAFVDFEAEFSVWSPLALIRCDNEKIHSKFVFYSLQSDYLQSAISQTWSKGTQENIAMRAIEELPILIPPIDKQIEIVNYIEKYERIFGGIITIINQMIKNLKEYRTALISAAVTGKIDVRGLA